MANIDSRFIYCPQCFEKRCLVIERFACISYENSGDAQSIVYDECRWWGIPCGVSACFECIAYTAIGEGRSIRLLLNEQFACKLFHHSSFAIVLYKSIMFFGCTFGEWSKPVRIMSSSHFNGPLFHSGSHFIGNTTIQRSTVINYVSQFVVHSAWQILEHLLFVEHILREIFRRAFCGSNHFHRFLLESCLYNSESKFWHKL